MNKLIVFSILFFLINIQGQAVNKGIRYHIVQSAMLDLIEENPEKESYIKTKIKELPAFMDYYLINNQLHEIYWKQDSSFLGMQYYDSLKNVIINIDQQGSLFESKLPDSLRFSFSEPKDTIINKIKMSMVEVKSRILFPSLLIFKPDSLQAPKAIAFENLIPEVWFINKYHVYPVEILIGLPKQIATFKAMKILPDYHKSILALIKGNIKKKEKMEMLRSIRLK